MHEPLLGVLFVYLSSFSSVFVPKILCLCVSSQLSRLFLLPFTASVFGACVCVRASKRYTIDGENSYLLQRYLLNKKQRRAMPQDVNGKILIAEARDLVQGNACGICMRPSVLRIIYPFDDSEVCHPRCVFKLEGGVNFSQNTTINMAK